MDYDHILAATDFSDLGDVALGRAARLAALGGKKLTVLHVLPTPEAPSPIFAHYEMKPSEEKLAEARVQARALLEERVPDEVIAAGLDIEYVVRVGDPASEILACDGEHKPDLIVVATHGRRGWKRWVMGSVAERVVQMAKADVLAVREHEAAFAEGSVG